MSGVPPWGWVTGTVYLKRSETSLPSMFSQLYAAPCRDWPTLRQRRTGRLVTVASLHEAPLAYAIVNFEDGDSLAVPAHELDTLYERADVDDTEQGSSG